MALSRRTKVALGTVVAVAIAIGVLLGVDAWRHHKWQVELQRTAANIQQLQREIEQADQRLSVLKQAQDELTALSREGKRIAAELDEKGEERQALREEIIREVQPQRPNIAALKQTAMRLEQARTDIRTLENDWDAFDKRSDEVKARAVRLDDHENKSPETARETSS